MCADEFKGDPYWTGIWSGRGRDCSSFKLTLMLDPLPWSWWWTDIVQSHSTHVENGRFGVVSSPASLTQDLPALKSSWVKRIILPTLLVSSNWERSQPLLSGYGEISSQELGCCFFCTSTENTLLTSHQLPCAYVSFVFQPPTATKKLDSNTYNAFRKTSDLQKKIGRDAIFLSAWPGKIQCGLTWPTHPWLHPWKLSKNCLL